MNGRKLTYGFGQLQLIIRLHKLLLLHTKHQASSLLVTLQIL